MFISIKKRNNLFLFIFLFIGMTSCCSKFCPYQECFEIPCHWDTPIKCGMTLEDPTCFLWWRELEDPTLTALVEQAAFKNTDVRLAEAQSKDKLLEAVNSVASEVAKTYIELRGLQLQSEILQKSIDVQNLILTYTEELSNKGFLSLINQNQETKNLDILIVQNSQIELSIKKSIFHLSTMLSYPPGSLCLELYQTHKLPELPCEIPVGYPLDLVRRNPEIRETRKAYKAAPTRETFLNYQKAVLGALEKVENSLASFHHSLEKNNVLRDVQNLKAESYQLTKDLYDRGLKDDRELLTAYQEYLSEEITLIQIKTELLSSYVTLYQALGVGWEVDCH